MRPIPSPKGLPVFGTMLSIMAAGGAPKLHLYVDQRHKELGPIYKEKIGPVTGIFIADGNYMRKIFGAEGKYPKHIVPESWLLYNEMYGCKRGLLFMDGEEWLNFRKLLNNLMLKVNQNKFLTEVDIVADNLVESWRNGGKITDLEKLLYKWSLEVIVAVLLGRRNYINYKNDLSALLTQLSEKVHQIFIESAKLSLIPAKFAVKMKLPVWRRFVNAASSAVQKGNKMVEKLLDVEKRNPSSNLLSEMLNTGMELNDLKRIVTDLILAAGDTTAHSTQWLLHLLSLDLSCQEAIHNELKQYSQNEIHQCPLLKGALKEALRLCPVSPFITRFLPEDLVLDNYLIRAEELVLMSMYSSGRNDKYFSQPELFLPHRWLRNGKTYEGVTNPNASLPFAMGSRSCIGRKIAETQILVTISKILQNFIIKSDNKKRIDITLHLISVPAEPIELILEPRENQKNENSSNCNAITNEEY